MPALTITRSMPPSASDSSPNTFGTVVVVDVQRGYGDVDVRIALREFSFEFLEPFGTTGAQGQVTALGGERAGHSGA